MQIIAWAMGPGVLVQIVADEEGDLLPDQPPGCRVVVTDLEGRETPIARRGTTPEVVQ